MTDSTRRRSRGAAVRAFLMLSSAVAITPVAMPSASAQDYTNIAASGRVTAQDGQPISGATVKITSTDRGVSRTATTDDAGAYTIPQLAPGNYDFTVTAQGFTAYTEHGIALTRDAGGANSFRLVPETQTGDIVVTGSRQRVADFQDTTVGSTIDLGSLTTRVPIGRSLRDVILLTPGAVQGQSPSNSSFANQVSIAGAAFTENAFYINGLNVTDFVSGGQPTEVPFDFYQTVEVKTGGAPAEFGRATGGYVVATTKSGSNEYHASMTGIWEPDGLRSTSPTYQTNSTTTKSATDWRRATASRKEAIFELSGPIIKDHLFVYGLYNFRDIRSLTPANSQDNATGVTNTSPFWGGKVDAYITGDHHFEFTYFDTTNDTRNRSYNWDRATGTLGAQVSGTNSRAGGVNYVGRYTGTFTPWLTVSGAYGVNRLRAGNAPLDTVNSQVTDYRDDPVVGKQIGINRLTDAFSSTNDQREFYRFDADVQFHLLGSHHIRGGYDHEKDTQSQKFETIGAGAFKIYRIATDQQAADVGQPIGTEYYTTRVYAQDGVAHVRNEAFYLQDQWSLFNDRLRFDLGLRDDRFSNQGVNGKSFFKSGDQWGPRLGVSFDPIGDGRTKVYGSYSKYYLPMAGDLNLNVAGSLVTYTRYNFFNGLGTGNIPKEGAPLLTQIGLAACPDTGIKNCLIQADGSPFDPSTQIAANIKPQSDNEFIIGAQHQFSDRIRVGAYFTHRELTNAIEDISIDLGARTYCQSKGFSADACAAIYTGGRQSVIANPGRDVTVQLVGLPDGSKPVVTLKAADLQYPKAQRNYNALSLTFDRSFDQKWSLSASYTLAFDKGNYEGGVRSENGQLSINRSADFDSPSFTNGAYGYLPNDRRHTFKAYGSYRLFQMLDLGANAVVQSPAHYSCIGTVPKDIDLYAYGYQGYSYYCNGVLVPRGTAFNGDWLTQLDVNAVVHVALPLHVDASVRLDVYNLLNSKAVTSYNNFGEQSGGGPNPLFHTPVNYQTPRYVRLTARFGF